MVLKIQLGDEKNNTDSYCVWIHFGYGRNCEWGDFKGC